MSEPLLTIADLLRFLRLSRQSLHRLRAADATFPKPYRVGRSKRWRKDEITKWLEGQR